MRQSFWRTSLLAAWALSICASLGRAQTVEVSGAAPVSLVAEGDRPNHRDPTICVDGQGGLYLGYVAADAKLSRFIAIASTDSGATFRQPVALTLSTDQPSTASRYRSRSIAFPGGGVVFAWYDQGVASGDIDLMVATSSDGGVSFEKRRQVDTARKDVRQGGADLIEIEGDRLVAAWVDLRGGLKHAAVYASVSSDRGLSWERQVEPWYLDVSPAGGVRFIVDPKDRLYIVYRVPGEKESHDPMWAKIELRRKGELDAKPAKAVRRRKSRRVRDEPESAPVGIAISKSGDMGCLWRTGDERKPRLLFAASKNRGVMWKAAVELPIEEGSEPDHPQLAPLPGGDLLAAWEGSYDRGEAIFLSRSGDGGATWSEPTRLEGARSLAIARKLDEKGLSIAYRGSVDQRIHVAFLK